MSNNTNEKGVVGFSPIMHLNKGFAIATIALFMTVLLIFSVGWAGVIAADAIVDNVVNPIIKSKDPDAEEIDVMAIFNPPTSESQASKVYAEFPKLDFKTLNSYTAEIEGWYDDHLPFRSIIYNENERAELMIESRYGELQSFLAQKLCQARDAYRVLVGEEVIGDSSGSDNAENSENNAPESLFVSTHTAGDVIRVVEPSYTTYGYTLVRCADCGGEYRTDIKAKLIDTSFALPIYRGDANVVMEGRYQWLFYRGDNSEAYFRGTNIMTDEEMAENMAILKQLDDLCYEKGITLQICIWPNKDQVYPEYVTWTTETEDKRVERFVRYMNKNSGGVKIIYPIDELTAMKPYYDVYLKYDTHWNCAGGFVGYQAMLESLGLKTVDIRNCEVYEYTGVETEHVDPYFRNVGGDLIGLGQLSSSVYNGGHNYYVNYRPEIEVDTFTGGNGANDTRHTTASNATFDMNFVMFADSYRVMQLGYLEKDFSDCFLAHRHRVNDEDCKEAIKNADILVIAAVERYESDIFTTAKNIIGILSENAQ